MPADPYRVNDAAPRRTETSFRRSTTLASALPLAVIAFAFFLPFTRSNERVTTPLREATDGPGAFFVCVPTFLSAAVLCAAIVYTFATKRAATRAALAAMGWSVLAAAWVVVMTSFDKDEAWLLFAVAAVCAPFYGFAWSSRGLRRLSLLVDAYLFASLPVAGLSAASAKYYGAYVFVGAYVLLVVLRAIELMSRGVEALRGAPRERAPGRRPAR